MEDSYLGMLNDDPYSEYNYYGLQVYVSAAASPGPSPYANLCHPYVNHPIQPSTSTSYITTNQIESSQVEESRADESGKKGKGPKKQAAK